ASYPENSDALAFWREALTRINALPGVQAVASADGRPTREINMTNNFDLEDKPTPPGQSQPTTPWVGVTPGYFETLRIPLLEGRVFDERDNADAPPVAVVDQAWARRFFPNDDAVGKRFYSGGCTTCPMFTVVGVVGDVKHTGLDAVNEGTVYWPLTLGTSRSRFILARTGADAMSALPSIRQIVRELDPALPLSRIATTDELISESMDTPRYLTILVAAFAAVALLLSIIGIYGVMSYFVQQHTRDIGIRIALGGGPSNVIRMVVRQGMQIVTFGMVVGIAGALLLTRYMSSVLFEVGATDPVTFALVSVVMLGVALLACFVPARRAAGVDPASTLRED
ncbi:MAG: ABC transporter permease, partial [Phycisphaerae bacterium]